MTSKLCVTQSEGPPRDWQAEAARARKQVNFEGFDFISAQDVGWPRADPSRQTAFKRVAADYPQDQPAAQQKVSASHSSTVHKDTKNQADRKLLVKTVELDFSNTQKQKNFNRTNGSVLHKMHQKEIPKELIEKGGNAKLIPSTKKGIDIKLAANQSKALENKSV